MPQVQLQDHVAESTHGKMEKAEHAHSLAQSRAAKVGGVAQKMLREHPLASMGVALSGGILIGAVAHKLFEHRPTLGELLAKRVGVGHVHRRT